MSSSTEKVGQIAESKSANSLWSELKHKLPTVSFYDGLDQERQAFMLAELENDFATWLEIVNESSPTPYTKSEGVATLQAILDSESKPFLAFICAAMSEAEKQAKADINDLPYTLDELGMTKDELEHLLATSSSYDRSAIVQYLMRYHLAKHHASQAYKYYKAYGITTYNAYAQLMHSCLNSL